MLAGSARCAVLCCTVLLTVQDGQAPLSDLQCTTSSEALLAGKAPTFRLLVWAIDRHTGEQALWGRRSCQPDETLVGVWRALFPSPGSVGGRDRPIVVSWISELGGDSPDMKLDGFMACGVSAYDRHVTVTLGRVWMALFRGPVISCISRSG